MASNTIKWYKSESIAGRLDLVLSGFMRVLAFINRVRTHWVLNWNALILDWVGFMINHEMSLGTHY